MTGKGRGEAPASSMKRRVLRELGLGNSRLFPGKCDHIDIAVVAIPDIWKQWYEKRLRGFWRGGNAHE
ncbi:hypothetical protein AS034_01405 [[Bacillus] enclensis]|uniref:Uncharacterized protein n=1 Tax=[Bacillus] enclensis TaxID=1402860 RepID=A0A0V8HPN3_9BACI|nr:hypothetical protein AS034_01405 [[Bacillus] enclensis]SCB75489.1 hypothetical protein GA0061094_0290 [[Bacillus] enclensis]